MTVDDVAGLVGAWLLRASWEASIVIIVVLAVRFLLRRWLTPRWQYALWLIVVARLVMPAVPASPTSVFNLVGLAPGRTAGPATFAAPIRFTRDVRPVSAAAMGRIKARPAHPWKRLPTLAVAGWAVVALGLLARLGLRSYRLTSKVCRQRPVTQSDVVDLLEDCKQELGVHIPINVVQSSQVETPALLGFVRPRLLLPERLLEIFDREALRLLFLHELAHVRRRDILVNWIATLVHVLHWFNPLVALAMARMRADRELATDSLVLSHRGEAENRPYGETLVRLVEFAVRGGLLPGTVGVLEDRAELKRRVVMIASHSPHAYHRSVLALAVLLGLAATTLTNSVSATGGAVAAADSATNAVVSVVVEDDNGRGVEGATVFGQNTRTNTVVTAKSAGRGAYALVAPAGTYSIAVEAPQGRTSKLVELQIGQETQVRLRLFPEARQSNQSWSQGRGRSRLAYGAERLRSGKPDMEFIGVPEPMVKALEARAPVPSAEERIFLADLFEELSKSLPDFVWLTGFQRVASPAEGPQSVYIDGYTQVDPSKGHPAGLALVTELVANLQRSGRFGKVEVLGTREQDGKVEFEIKTGFELRAAQARN